MLTNDLNNTLSIYNVKISKAYIDELTWRFVKDTNLQEKKESLHSKKPSNCIFDGSVVFTLSNAN